MNLKFKNYSESEYISKLQEGGTVPVEPPVEEAPAEPQDPMQELLMAAQQALESQDCNLAMQICQALMEMAGGGQPAPEAPAGQEPVYRAGGKLKRWNKK